MEDSNKKGEVPRQPKGHWLVSYSEHFKTLKSIVEIVAIISAAAWIFFKYTETEEPSLERVVACNIESRSFSISDSTMQIDEELTVSNYSKMALEVDSVQIRTWILPIDFRRKGRMFNVSAFMKETPSDDTFIDKSSIICSHYPANFEYTNQYSFVTEISDIKSMILEYRVFAHSKKNFGVPKPVMTESYHVLSILIPAP